MIYRLPLLLLLVLLQACFYVELTGNVAGSLVSVRPLRGGPDIVSDLPTTTVEQARAEHGREAWDSFGKRLKLLLVGWVDLPSDEFVDDKLYLVTARGGLDMDWNGDRLIEEGVPIDGVIHSIMTGEQLKQPNQRMNLLTDAIYRLLQPRLARLTDRQVLARMDELASEAVMDVDGNGMRDYRDVLKWSQLRSAFPYPGLDEFLIRQEIAIGWGLDDQVTRLNAESLVMRADWRPAVPGSAYADQLVACSVPVLELDLCPFRQLPLIGQDTTRPSVDDIMPRVVVTHDWMTRRFREVLERFPEDLLLLFRSVSVIVIGDDIRPSYYLPASAAVFLDADNLWVTQRERDTISKESDYRVEYASRVNFVELWRLVKGNNYIGELDANGNGNGTIEDVTLWMASLLLHELAHANDYLPAKMIEQLSPRASPYTVATRPRSDILASEFPLQASELFGVAAVLFHGFVPTPTEARYEARDIAFMFARDRAVDLYSYSSPQEDLAMLFEEAMMKIHFDVQRDIAFTNLPPYGIEEPLCSDYVVAWGVRGRIGAAHIKPRLNLVLEELLPNRNYSGVVDGFEKPIPMRRGRDWCDNLDLGKTASAPLLQTRSTVSEPRIRTQRRYL